MSDKHTRDIMESYPIDTKVYLTYFSEVRVVSVNINQSLAWYPRGSNEFVMVKSIVFMLETIV